MPITNYTPIIYKPIQHPLTQEANLYGFDVEEYLKLLEAQNNQKAVIYTTGEDPTKYRPGANKLSVDTAREIKAEEELKLKQEAAKAAEAIIGMGLPSTYVNTGLEWSGRQPLSQEASIAFDLGLPLGIGAMKVAAPIIKTGIKNISRAVLEGIKRGNNMSSLSNGQSAKLSKRTQNILEDVEHSFRLGREEQEKWKLFVAEQRQLDPSWATGAWHTESKYPTTGTILYENGSPIRFFDIWEDASLEGIASKGPLGHDVIYNFPMNTEGYHIVKNSLKAPVPGYPTRRIVRSIDMSGAKKYIYDGTNWRLDTSRFKNGGKLNYFNYTK